MQAIWQRLLLHNAAKQKLTALPSMEFKQMDFQIQGLGDCRSLIKWAYENKSGAVSEPFNLNDRYVVAMVSAINNKGLSSVESVKSAVESIVRNEKKAQIIISSKIKGGSLDEIAKNAATTVKVADSISFASYSFGQEGNEVKLIGASFNKQFQNKMSKPIAGSTGVFVIRGEGVSGTASLGSNADAQRSQLEATLKQQAGYQITNLLKEAADIDDNRSEFY
jgi:peptidyl-prolyl cis-trans isomerase D